MARHRTIDENAILDAAERVIVEHGAANFTLDAVATAAGISKGSVVRDCGSKQDLIREIVRRRFGQYTAMLDEAERAQLVPGAQARIAAHLQVMASSLPEEERVAAVQLCSSLPNDTQLVEIITKHYRKEIEAVSTPGAVAGALLAFLALEGLRSLELFGSLKWRDGERDDVLAQIAALATIDPGNRTSE